METSIDLERTPKEPSDGESSPPNGHGISEILAPPPRPSERIAIANSFGPPAVKTAEQPHSEDQDTDDGPNRKRQVLDADRSPPITPREMVRYLDRYVIGSEEAKRALAIAAYHHQCRFKHVPGCEMVERVLKNHFEEGKREDQDAESNDNAMRLLVRSITEALRSNPISNRSDSRARKDVCLLLRTYEEQRILKLRDPPSVTNGKKKSKASSRKSSKRTHDNPSGRYARVVDAFVKERLASDRLVKKADRSLETSRDIPLIIGQSGSGKSMVVRYMAAKLGLPFVHVDSSQLTEAGWRGEDVESIPSKLLLAAERMLPKATKREKIRLASYGVVFLDEIDKKAWIGEGGHEHSRTGAQSSLLITLDGYVDHETGVDLSTCMFVVGGSFSGASVGISRQTNRPDTMLIAEIVKKRLGISSFGFGAIKASIPSLKDLLLQVGPKDLIEFGIIPELAGRLQPVPMTPMTEDLLLRIIEESRESALRVKLAALKKDGIEVRVTKEAKQEIAQAVLKQGLGARPLRFVVGRILQDLEFRAPDLSEETSQVIRFDEESIRARLAEVGL